MAFYPVLSRTFVEDTRAFLRAQAMLVVIMLVLALTICSTGVAFREEVMLSVFGEKYRDGIGVFGMLLLFVFLFLLRTSFGIPLLAMGQQKARAITSGIGLIVCAITGACLIPSYGIMGSAWSLTVAESVSVTAMIAILRKKVLERDGKIGASSDHLLDNNVYNRQYGCDQ